MIGILILVFIASISKAISDYLAHYRTGGMTWWGNSPGRKWADPVNRIERFPLSSTSLVWVTDAWHFFNTVRKAAWVGAILFAIRPETVKSGFWTALCIYVVTWIGFNLVYEGLKKYLS